MILKSNNRSNDMIYLNCNDLDQITNRLFKEAYENNKDVFGTDAILLENDKTKENTLVVHRIQIKLATSNVKKTDVENIINTIKTNETMKILQNVLNLQKKLYLIFFTI
jgi:hypothetical protein